MSELESKKLRLKIVLTRSELSSKMWTGVLQDNGLDVVCVPLTGTRAWKSDLDNSPSSFLEKKRWDWIAFTSQNAVVHFIDRMAIEGRDFKDVEGVKIASIGPKTTSALKNVGVSCDFESSKSDSQSMADELVALLSKTPNQKFLLPRAKAGLTTLEDTLMSFGHKVFPLPIYETYELPADLPSTQGFLRSVQNHSVFAVLVFAPSQGKRLWELLQENCASEDSVRDLQVWALGPTTYNALKELGFKNVHLGNTDPVEFVKKLQAEQKTD